MSMEVSEINLEEEGRSLVEAVRRSPVVWASLSTPAMLVVVLLLFSFGFDREPAMSGSTAQLLVVFILISLAEALLMPWYFLDQASRRLSLPLTPEGTRDFANFYGFAMIGGTTPCVLGLAYYVLSGNLPLALLLYAIGLADVLYYVLNMRRVVAYHLAKAGSPPDAAQAPDAPDTGQ
jgi:hypothetical protein